MSIFHSGISPDVIRTVLEIWGARVHFIGVGGVGMHPLAALLLARGKRVTGTDARAGALTEDLKKRGADIRIGSSSELVRAADLVVYSLAVSEADPDIIIAEELGKPTCSRAELLGAVMTDYPLRLGVSGSHGKSTVTAMTDAILKAAGKDPTTLVGAALSDTGLPIRIGSGAAFVYEACEYKDSFLRFSPSAAVYTSLELDHTDYFRNIDALKSSFRQSASSCPLPVLSLDSEPLSEISASLKRCITYGEDKGDISARITAREKGKYSLKIRHASGVMPEIPLCIPGRFNAKNALSAAALTLSIGISEDAVIKGLSSFSGLGRRMEYIGMAGNCRVYYDYAHHPTEVAAVISTLREAEGLPVTVIFKPHTFSRTRAFLSEFAAALSLADRVILLDIDPVREKSDGKIMSSDLAAKITSPVLCASERDVTPLALEGAAATVVLMGAGEVGYILRELKSATRVKGNAENVGE